MFAIYRASFMIIIIYFYLFCICKVFIITKYDNNVIIIFDDSKFIHYPFSLRYSSNNVITTISFLELYSYYQN